MDYEFKHVPTLVIGLGGTGNEIARLLKSKFAQRYPDQETLIRYLIIDTDRKSFRDGFWDREEQVFLRLSMMPRHILSAFYNNEQVDWLPQDPRINPDHFVNQEAGAGLIRPIGRLYFQDQVTQVRDRLEKAKNSLSDLWERKRTGTILGTGDFQVYIISSLAGGSGSGAYLDLAALVRDLFEENCFISGIFTLYSCYADVLRGDVDQARRSKANCYAALKELEFFMQEKDESQPELYTIKYWDGARVNLYKRLFNTCYLVENSNDGGAQLSNLSQIYELCAQQLYQEIGSPLGEDYRSKINNLSFFQSGLRGEEWRDWSRKRRFSSFGNVCLVYPRHKVEGYCSNRLLQEVARQLNTPVAQIAQQELKSLINKLGLEVYEGRLALLDELLLNDREGLLCYRIGEFIPAKLDLVIGRYLEEVEHSMPGLGQEVESSLKYRLNEWLELLEDTSVNRIKSKGLTYTLQLLAELAQQLSNTLELCQNALEQSRQDGSLRGQELADKRSRLRGVGAFSRIFGGRILVEEAAEAYHAWLECRWEREVLARLNSCLQQFLDRLEQRQQQVSQWQQEMVNLAKQAGVDLEELAWRDEQSLEATVLVQEVMAKEDCERFFLANAPEDPAEVVERVWPWTGDMADKLRAACAAYFVPALDKLSIVEFLRQKFAEQGKEAWNELLDELREICRPFWTAHLKHGEYYNQTCLVGIAKEDAGFPAEVVAWAKDRSDATRGIDCVNTYYPYAIDITVCTHGAFAGYLSGIKDYYFQYEQFLRGKEFPLHLHEQYKYLPELDPYRDKIGQFFALARAYGLIAENNEGYFFALNRGTLGWEIRFKTKALVKPANWEEYADGIFPAIPRRGEAGFLGLTRESAQASLADNSTFISLVDSFVRERIKRLGKDKVKQELQEYWARLTTEKGQGAPLLKEIQALKIFTAAQLEAERAYG